LDNARRDHRRASGLRVVLRRALLRVLRQRARLRGPARSLSDGPDKDHRSLGRRNVLPWRPSGRRGRSLAFLQEPQAEPLRHRRLALGRDADWTLLWPHCQFHQWRAVGEDEQRPLGNGLPERVAPRSATPSESTLRSLARGRAPLSDPSLRNDAAGDPQAARFRDRLVPAGLRRLPVCGRIRPRLGIDDLRLVQHGAVAEPADVGRCGLFPLVRGTAAADGPSGIVNELKRKLLDLIEAQGPLTVAQYMAIALGDAE